MKIHISEPALEWFKKEIEFQEGNNIKFFTQIYGSSPIQPNYALAFMIENDTSKAAVQTVVQGITFFVEETDLWFFKDYDLHLAYNTKTDELEFQYVKE